MSDPYAAHETPMRTTDRTLRFRVVVRRSIGETVEASFASAWHAVSCESMWRRMPSTTSAFLVDSQKEETR